MKTSQVPRRTLVSCVTVEFSGLYLCAAKSPWRFDFLSLQIYYEKHQVFKCVFSMNTHLLTLLFIKYMIN